MANDIEWGQGAKNNAIGWGQGAANNSIGWGLSHLNSPSGETEIYGIRQDANVTAFLTATGITDTTITSALEDLVADLKSYSIWDKMKAIYPFVGGTATTHKFNLKDPRDLDVAFRLAFNGGWTHSSNGALPNGTNGFADTFLTPSTSLSLNSTHLSLYSRTNKSESSIDIGCQGGGNATYAHWNFATTTAFRGINSAPTTRVPIVNTTGLLTASRIVSNNEVYYSNGAFASNFGANSTALTAQKIIIGARNNGGTADLFANKQYAFASIGDGLTDEDSANLYYSVQKFQTTLGRQVGTPIYSSNATDVNARLFLGATNIQDATITSAVDTLVQGLKTDGVWSKLKAVYPFVGGTATTHKFNLANALDEDSAFRLAFSGGITHSSNGALGNGTNGYANTFIAPLTNLSQNNVSVNIYSRTDGNGGADFGCPDFLGYLKTAGKQYFKLNQNTSFSIATNSIASTGLFSFIRTNSTQESLYKNGSLVETFNKNSVTPNAQTMYLLGYRSNEYSNRQFAFASIGDGLTPTETSNLYTRVQAFQTTLNRQV
jgi:hypothetical protein